MSLEERLYEAYRLGRGLRLSSGDVQDLVGPDTAIRTRIVNAIAGYDHGEEFSDAEKMETAAQMKKRLNESRQ